MSSIIKVDNIQNSSGTSAISIDDDGVVTQPAKPAFRVQRTSNVSANNTIVWDTEVFDIGSNFNTSTGTFTAPVDGVYMFSGWVWGASSEPDIVLSIRVNATIAERFVTQPSIQSGQEIGSAFSALLQLDANDAVTVHTERNLRGLATYAHFAGFLVG